MTANKNDTVRSSRQLRIKSDLTRVDAHVIQATEYDDLPDLADRDLSEGFLEIAGKTVRRGRPVKVDRKLSTTIRLDPDILAHFKSGGRGWQGRINDALRKSMQG